MKLKWIKYGLMQKITLAILLIAAIGFAISHIEKEMNSVSNKILPNEKTDKAKTSTITYALDKVMNLRGVDYSESKNFDDSDERRGHLGFVVGEIEEVLPEVVETDSEGYKTVAYSQISPLLVEAIKAQQKRLEMLEMRLNTLAKE